MTAKKIFETSFYISQDKEGVQAKINAIKEILGMGAWCRHIKLHGVSLGKSNPAGELNQIPVSLTCMVGSVVSVTRCCNGSADCYERSTPPAEVLMEPPFMAKFRLSRMAQIENNGLEIAVYIASPEENKYYATRPGRFKSKLRAETKICGNALVDRIIVPISGVRSAMFRCGHALEMSKDFCLDKNCGMWKPNESIGGWEKPKRQLGSAENMIAANRNPYE